jgi:acyl-CoA synthetase (AMP-forming)/AMP-acid ligase II
MTTNKYKFFMEELGRDPNGEFITTAQGSLTYGEFMERAVRILNFLQKQGVRHGDRVVVALENRPEFLELATAMALGGIVLCSVDPQLPQKQIRKIKQAAKAKIVISSYDDISYSLDKTVPGSVSVGAPEDPFLIVFSSGTTGEPKGIIQSFAGFFGSARSFAKLAGFKAGAVTFHHWPMFYNAGIFNLFAAPLVSNGKVFIGKRYSAKTIQDFWREIAQAKPAYLYLSPTMAASLADTAGLLKISKDAFGSATIISTSSVLYPAIRNKFRNAFDKEIVPCFGITELGGSFTYGGSEPFSVGRVIAEAEVKIDPAADNEILVRTPHMAIGYLRQDGSVTAFDRETFYRSNDLGGLKNGELFVYGRKGDQIKKGGEMLNLLEIEDLIIESGLCQECAAVGRKDEFWGDVYDIYVVKKPDDSAVGLKDRVQRYLNDALPVNQRPSKVEEIMEMPRTGSGKAVKRLVLYAEAAQ